MAARRAVDLLLILALVSGCISADPCTDSERVWMENGRRSSDFYSENTETSICDAFLEQDKWYRFEHDAGNRLIEKPVEPWYCGTQAPIWLNGTHPTDTREVTATVCASYSHEKICGWNGTVRIRLCNEPGGGYFVYKLATPPGCPLAYCVDSASRKKCTPPEIWLQDEFKCGERAKTTPAPSTTSPSTPERPSSSGWSSWSSWSNCKKSCDHGLQTRSRTCGQLPCPGAATSQQLCAKSNCKERKEEKNQGIVLILESANDAQNTMFAVVVKQQKIFKILRNKINRVCSQNASLCCGFQVERISSDEIEFVTSDGIYAAKGFPRQISEGTVHTKIIAIVNEAVSQGTCNGALNQNKPRHIRSADSNSVPFEVMQMAARSSTSDILKETELTLKDVLNPETYPGQDDSLCPTTTCIVPIVACCTVILTLAIIVGSYAMIKKSKKSPKLLMTKT